ncbi:MAG: hypothetical protein HY985_06645 [Magnetospirillum sp.]|nr:hypothetical protein [Magnetospirillum sp.]
MQYLVMASGGPASGSPDVMVALLETAILPCFDALLDLEKSGAIHGGGLPVGERAFVFVIEAASNADLDDMLRGLPAWGLLEWEVKPLQSFAARSERERQNVAQLNAVRSGVRP